MQLGKSLRFVRSDKSNLLCIHICFNAFDLFWVLLPMNLVSQFTQIHRCLYVCACACVSFLVFGSFTQCEITILFPCVFFFFFLFFLFIVLNMCINVCNQHQHQRIPHPFPHLSLPPPPTTDRVIDTLAMPPNVTAALQQKQHQPFIPSPAPNKYAHMHNVSGFIYNLYNGNDNNKWNFKLCFK